MKETQNPDLQSEVVPNESELKQIIVNYVGEKVNPENDEVTVENVIDIFAQQFPEFLLVVAEENWINGYTQALTDVDYVKRSVSPAPEYIEENSNES
tara:strand:- start:4957 stop:5247 length:291 start_codon:yes stop_codon:yes gene_type:complete